MVTVGSQNMGGSGFVLKDVGGEGKGGGGGRRDRVHWISRIIGGTKVDFLRLAPGPRG